MENEPPSPTPAAVSRPILALLLIVFFLNAGSGIGLWMAPPQTSVQQGWRVFHGWTVPLFLITLGVIWRVHALRGWKLKKNILSGTLILGIFLILTITGWVIYYPVGSDKVQKKAADWHTWLGLGSSFILLAHVLLGLRTRKEEDH